MQFRAGRSGILLACFTVLLISGASADSGAGQPARESLVDDLVALSELIVEHHFQPPTRQQLVLEAARGIYECRKQEPPADLARQCSLSGNDQKFREILLAALGVDSERDAVVINRGVTRGGSSAPEPDVADLMRAAVLKLNAVVPGGLELQTPKAHAANQQLSESRYVGVGIAVRMTDDHEFQIVSAVEGGPMQTAGVPQESIIEEIDGWKTREQRLEECVDRLRGPKGTSVNLKIRRPAAEQAEPLTLTRGVVPIKSLQARGVVSEGKTILHLQLSQITSSVSHETRQALTAQKELHGIVLDLRGTQSGPAHFAVLFADLFLGEGRLGTAWRGGKRQALSSGPDELVADVPVAVLVNEYTAGSAEWLAAVLKESGRAEVFGTPSAGLAVDNQSFALPSGERHATFATVVLETSKSGKLLGMLTLGQFLARGIDVKAPEDTITAGRIYPRVERAEPGFGAVVSNLFTPAQPLRAPVGLTTGSPPMDPLNAAMRYLVQQSQGPSAQ
ncbi:MAG TPA: S41 family peptidase [Caulifigura sp.]|nr:S41 family peptidase [Caulifigura sp.]